MRAIARPDFRRDAADYRVAIMQAMRCARQAAGQEVEEWAATLGVLPAAVLAYEAGSNVPCTDTWLLAMELAGRPALRMVEHWTQRTARRLAHGSVLHIAPSVTAHPHA